jgi:diguanylate cyclase (GGDEF)-like protein
VIAGCVVLGLLLYRWLPSAVRERGRAEQRAQDLENLAAVDGLTGLYNRRHFETLARSELARCQRYVRPLSLLLLDVDHFKLINDRLGHAAGDRVLRRIAEMCSASKRDSDVVGRIGGEEFAVLLPETAPDAAQQFAERLRSAVRESPIVIEGETIVVTVSIGVAGATLRTSSIDALSRFADQALYDAKRAGRDQVVVCRPIAEPKLALAAE